MILTLILFASSLWQINKRMEYYLTNRFNVARASFQWWIADDIKIWQDQKMAREPGVIVSLMVLTTLWSLLWSITEQTHGNMESIRFIQSKKRKEISRNLLRFKAALPDCSRIWTSLGRYFTTQRSTISCLFFLHLIWKQFNSNVFQGLHWIHAEEKGKKKKKMKTGSILEAMTR